MITHRLNLNYYADEIIYIGRNSYVEQGKHSDLLKNGKSRYKTLWDDYVSTETSQ
jgi:ABC-type transport system involved in Fe-S cluster assembly fused permease/ATPase subunit